MASATPPTPAPHPPRLPPEPLELTIVSHSNLFYWWPVWAVAIIFGFLTMIENRVMSVVPADAQISPNIQVGDNKNQTAVFIANEKKGSFEIEQPRLHITSKGTYGVLFTFVLLVVIFITNVPLRGMWSLIVIILIAFFVLLFAYFGVWDKIFEILSSLDIRITEGGYFMIGLGLFVIWLVTFMFFDRQIYITVTPGNFKVCTEIGGGEKVYDTAGMQMEKQRSDLFRHWVLGLGSGDLIVHTSGASNAHIDLPNVLFVGKKVQQIEDLIKKKSVVEAPQ